ncbi:MAG: hypothetical protein HY804_05800 [Nitrospinae bacterium]|nr:hypothetical protein [Nitrospinota bacterium]
MEATPLQVAGARQAGLSAPGEKMTPAQKTRHVDKRIREYMAENNIKDYREGMTRLFAADPLLKTFYASAHSGE